MSILWKQADLQPVVSDRNFKRFLRYPPARALEDPLADNAAWARAWFAIHARPWSCAIRADEAARARVGERFRLPEELAIVAVSAGAEAEVEAGARWTAGEPDSYFFLECYAAAVVDTLLADARHRLSAGKHFCPGYPGWPIEDNDVLLGALRLADALPGPLAMLPSGMLAPKKSQIAVCALHLAIVRAQ